MVVLAEVHAHADGSAAGGHLAPDRANHVWMHAADRRSLLRRVLAVHLLADYLEDGRYCYPRTVLQPYLVASLQRRLHLAPVQRRPWRRRQVSLRRVPGVELLIG